MNRVRRLPRLALLAGVLPLAACRSPFAALADTRSCLQVRGTFDARAPGYIVLYHEGVPVRATTDALAAKYGFTPKFTWETAVQGFAAELGASAVEGLRCEATIRLIEHDGIGSVD